MFAMSAPPGFTTGFSFSAPTLDESVVVVVNVCGHESVGMPLARSMDPVTEPYVDQYGVDNLIIPISVSPAKELRSCPYNYSVDVVIHPCLTSRCTKGHHLFEHLVRKLTTLSIQWVQQECGLSLVEGKCQLLGAPLYYRTDTERADPDWLRKTVTELEKALEQTLHERATSSDSGLPQQLDLQREREKKSGPLVKEILPTSGIKTGFLLGGSGNLYGPEGSKEGDGPRPDPLAHIPEKLRKQAIIVDTRAGLSEALKPPRAVEATPRQESSLSPTEPKASDDTWTVVSLETNEGVFTVRLQPTKPVNSMADVDLVVTETTIEIGGHVTHLPMAIDSDTVKAKYVKSTRLLVVSGYLKTPCTD